MFTTRLRAWQEKMGGLGTGASVHGCVCLSVGVGGEGGRMPCDHFLSLLLLLWARGWVSGITWVSLHSGVGDTPRLCFLSVGPFGGESLSQLSPCSFQSRTLLQDIWPVLPPP